MVRGRSIPVRRNRLSAVADLRCVTDTLAFGDAVNSIPVEDSAEPPNVVCRSTSPMTSTAVAASASASSAGNRPLWSPIPRSKATESNSS